MSRRSADDLDTIEVTLRPGVRAISSHAPCDTIRASGHLPADRGAGLGAGRVPDTVDEGFDTSECIIDVRVTRLLMSEETQR